MKRTSDKDEQRVVRLGRNNTVRSVAAKTGLHFATVARILKRHGYATARGQWVKASKRKGTA